MRNVATILLLALMCSAVFAQKTGTDARASAAKKIASAKKPATAKSTLKKSRVVSKSVAAKTVTRDPATDKEQLEAALALPTPAERASALKKFINDFPVSEYGTRARESLVGARAAFAAELLQANDNDAAVALFNLAVEEAPKPIPQRLFEEILSKFPANLYWHGQREEGLKIAASIEKKAEGSAPQLLTLAAFYLSIENGSDAKRLAETAAAIDPKSVTAYQTLGLAQRLNFNLEESAKAYEKTMELDPESSAARRSLAEMKRALGKPDEAAALYREVLAKHEDDMPARTGLILSLFNSGKENEAASEMTKSLEQNPKNLNLLAGAAYWYAARGDGEKAVQFAQKAVELEPRFIWGHIALARGMLSNKKPVEAERILVMARRYGNFPTLEYEIASARFEAGFYREAVEELQKSFTLKGDIVHAKLGGRVSREEKTFTDLIAAERRASIFEPLAADNPETAWKLKLLMGMVLKLGAASPNEPEIVAIADEFIKGEDKMKLHRQLHAASLLLEKKTALPKVLDLTKSATGNTEAGLDVSSPAAAVMANELYESRKIAFSRGEIILVPDVPRQTLSMILRGRIEELAGWTLYQQNNFHEAIIRFRRAISVLPDKSAWWRSSVWRLGATLEASGSDKEALDSYIQSYKTDKPDVVKYIVIQSLYKKVNGGTDGLEAKIGVNPMPSFIAEKQAEPEVKIAETVVPEVLAVAAAEAVPEPEVKIGANTPSPALEKSPEPEIKIAETPETKVLAILTPVLVSEPEAKIAANPLPSITTEKPIEPAIKIAEMPEPKILAVVSPESELKTEPTPLATPAYTETVEKMETVLPKNSAKNEELPKAQTTAVPATQTETDAEPIVRPKAPVVEAKPSKILKDLFEPIIITIPNSSSKKYVVKGPEKTNELSSVENKIEPKPEEANKGKPLSDEAASSGAARQRIVDGQEIKLAAPAPCSIKLSQEKVSLLNNGGSVGILAGIDGEGNVKDIAVSSSSPRDVEVTLEPEVGGALAQRFYIIKSVSDSTGIYQIKFETPCGKKELLVRVR